MTALTGSGRHAPSAPHIPVATSIHTIYILAHQLVEGGNQRLCQGEREHQLGSCGQQLGCQSLEKRGNTFVLGHVSQNGNSRFRIVKVSVLDPGLDHIERRRHDQRRRGTHNGSDKVLGPGGRRVVLQAKDVFLGKRVTTEKGKRTGSVSGRGPSPASVKTETFVCQDFQEPTATERLWVCLALDLQNVQWQQHNLTNSNQRTRGGRQQRFTGLWTEP